MANLENAIQVYDGAHQGIIRVADAADHASASIERLNIAFNQGFNTNILQMAFNSAQQINIVMGDIQQNVQNVNNSITEVADSYSETSDTMSQVTQEQQSINTEVQAGEKKAKKLEEVFKKIKDAAGNVKKQISEMLEAAGTQQEAERELQYQMRVNMNADDSQVKSIFAIMDQHQNSGVLSDQVQMAGAKELTGSLDNVDSLATLIPAMNDLAVQQSGVSASASDLEKIGKQMGEAMSGNLSPLNELGISFSEAQKHMMKYGDEQTRAATLAQVLSDNVGGMNAIMASTPQGKIQQMKQAWESIKETIGFKLYPIVADFFSMLLAFMPLVETIIMGLTPIISLLSDAMSGVLEIVTSIANFFIDNWSAIAPIILGIAAAIGVYLLYMNLANISVFIQAAAASLAAAAHAILSAIIATSPIVWIIMIVVILIGLLYGWAAAMSKTGEQTVSATGMIMGAFAALIAFIINTFFIPLWNTVVAFVNFFHNIWKGPFKAIKILFLDLALVVIDQVIAMAGAVEGIINKIPGVEINITAGLDKFKNQIEETSANIKDEIGWEEVVSKKDLLDYDKIYNEYYNKGEELEGNVKGFFDDLKNDEGFNTDQFTDGLYDGGGGGIANTWDGINQNTGNTAGNTAAMAESMDMAEEDLKSLRDIAEQEIINRFTTADLTVNMGGITNQVNSNMDLDGIASYLDEAIYETLEIAAEGVY